MRVTLCAVLLAAICATRPLRAADGAIVSAPCALSAEHAVGSRYMGVRLLGCVRVKAGAGGVVHQLSGLAWDDDDGVLYAVSDEGYVAHLVPVLAGDRLRAVRLRAVFPLRGPDGEPLAGGDSDAEGLVVRGGRNGVRGDAELIVSFEIRPRLEHFAPDGRYRGATALPEPLTHARLYAGANQQLEALTDVRGIGLVTAPERPLRGADRGIALYAMDSRHWYYPPVDPAHSGLVGLETLPGGALLILERRFVSLLSPFTVTLRRASLDTANGGLLAVHEVVHFDTSKGWALDNFEGVAYHRDQRVFLISDDNHRVFQNTLLVYLELNGPAIE